MSQNATSSGFAGSHGGRRKLPWVFTEHGAIMAASVLNSPRAVEVSVFVVRAFVKLRELAPWPGFPRIPLRCMRATCCSPERLSTLAVQDELP